MPKGKLIVLEGLDGSGKETQSKLLVSHLKSTKSEKVKRITFPDYESDGSAPIKMYLNGEILPNPVDVNPYAASILYAADRYISFTKELKSYYDQGYILIADRYTSSNLLYQGAKFDDFNDLKSFVDWAIDLEQTKLGLPEPNVTIYLQSDLQTVSKILNSRKSRNSSKTDIHENSQKLQENAFAIARKLSELLKWEVINITEQKGNSEYEWRSHQDIFNDIVNIINKYL